MLDFERNISDIKVGDIKHYQPIICYKKSITLTAAVNEIGHLKELPGSVFLTDKQGKLCARILCRKIMENIFPRTSISAKNHDFRSGWVPADPKQEACNIAEEKIFCISKDARVQTALQLMLKEKLIELPVVDSNQCPLGVLTFAGLLRSLKSFSKNKPTQSKSNYASCQLA
ncbi:MAG: CBS domain-containing protein [Lentisphaerae bacterium]|nr:CBS domain-containing protein [Lentisphaerota bacterium]MCP4100202.1 CBS domain-containing protein [Lentisphaerota bacterium]